MIGTYPPIAHGSSRLARRAVTTAVAAFCAIAVSVGLFAVTAGAPAEAPAASADSASASPTDTWFLERQLDLVQARADAEAVRFQPQASPAQPAVIETPAAAAPPPPAPEPAPEPEPEPEPEPAATGAAYGDPSDPASWDRLAQCESGGDWAINTGNGYYGGLQFSLASWEGVGGTGYPHEASRGTQIEMGQRLHAQGGWDHWPGCARQLGYI